MVGSRFQAGRFGPFSSLELITATGEGIWYSVKLYSVWKWLINVSIYWPLEKLLGVAENTMKYAAAADIWALGCVVSEFLLQFHPFSPPTSSRSNCYDKEEEEEEEGVGEVQVLSLIYKLLGPPPASMAQNMVFHQDMS